MAGADGPFKAIGSLAKPANDLAHASTSAARRTVNDNFGQSAARGLEGLHQRSVEIGEHLLFHQDRFEQSLCDCVRSATSPRPRARMGLCPSTL